MRLLLPVIALAATGCGSFKTSAAQCRGGPGMTEAALTGESLAEKTLALTFDGGPTAVTPVIGDFLFANGVRAAFFTDGQDIAEEPARLGRLKDREHLVGQRGYSGENLTKVPDPALEVRKTDELVTPYVSGDMFLLRAPEGAFDAALAARLNAAGLNKYVGPIGWEVGTSLGGFVDDATCLAQGNPPSTCAQLYLDRLRLELRGIVRLHASLSGSLEVLQIIIPKLRDEGFSFVRLDEVAPVRLALERAGGVPGTVGGPGGCDEY
jgi:peptidoglycan/xylan/chitin deacetylase (PgdA/CDA1 family)